MHTLLLRIFAILRGLRLVKNERNDLPLRKDMLVPPEAGYGAWYQFQKATGYKPACRPENRHRIHWQHGWHSEHSNIDPDLVVGEWGDSGNYRDHLFLVARADQEKALTSFGFSNVRAIGLPFAYALKESRSLTRRPRPSLLIMPGNHTTGDDLSYSWPEDETLIHHLAFSARSFRTKRVILFARDIDLGRSDIWNRAGFEVVRGADWHDKKTLSRLVKMFQCHDVVTTNAIGSHIAYAAASGIRVSIDGPRPEKSPNEMIKQTFYSNRPDLIPVSFKIAEMNLSDVQAMGMVCPPESAQRFSEWGRSQIGFDNILNRSQAKSLFERL